MFVLECSASQRDHNIAYKISTQTTLSVPESQQIAMLQQLNSLRYSFFLLKNEEYTSTMVDEAEINRTVPADNFCDGGQHKGIARELQAQEWTKRREKNIGHHT